MRVGDMPKPGTVCHVWPHWCWVQSRIKFLWCHSTAHYRVGCAMSRVHCYSTFDLAMAASSLPPHAVHLAGYQPLLMRIDVFPPGCYTGRLVVPGLAQAAVPSLLGRDLAAMLCPIWLKQCCLVMERGEMHVRGEKNIQDGKNSFTSFTQEGWEFVFFLVLSYFCYLVDLWLLSDNYKTSEKLAAL